MARKHRLIALLVLVSVALAALLQGCQSATPQASAAAPTSAAATPEPATPAPTPQVVELSMISQIPPEIVLDNNPVVALIEQQVGIRLKIEAPPLDSFGDRVKLVVSTGDMPDLFIYGADVAATQWAKQGLILDVTDKLKDYPNIVKNVSKQQMGDCEFLGDGHYYGIPRPNSYDSWGFLINKKWLEKVGKQVPTTVDEFIDVCTAFTKNDPDNNGKDDTYGCSFGAAASSLDSGVWHLTNDFLSSAYYISSWHAALPDKDGSFHLRALKSQYFDYLTALRNLYAANVIDREFITFNNANEQTERFAQQRVGIVGASEKNYTTNVLEKYNLNLDDYQFCAPLVLTKGDKAVYAMPPSNWMAYYVNAKTPKWADCLKLIDWGNSEDGFVAMQLGIAGTNYNSYDIQTRTIDRTAEQTEGVKKVTSNMFSFANAYDGKEALMGGSTKEQIAKWQKESAAAEAATRKCYMPFFKIVDQLGVQFPDVVQALNALEVRYVTGEATLEDLKAYVDGEFKTKTADLEKQFEDYMAKNPVDWKD